MKKRIITLAVVATLIFSMTACGGVSKKDYDEVKKKLDTTEKVFDSTEDKLTSQIEAYEKLQKEYDNYKEKMKPFEEMEVAEAEARKIAAAKESEEAEAEKKAQEAEAKAAESAAEEAKSIQVQKEAPPETTAEIVEQQEASSGETVWLSATGEKYHSIPNCGRMNPDKARQISLEDAQASGYDSCDNCI